MGTVQTPRTAGGFPGLWPLDSLPRNCWAPDSSSIFLSSAWGSRSVCLRVRADQLSAEPLEDQGDAQAYEERVTIVEEAAGLGPKASGSSSSVILLDVSAQGLLVWGSSPSCPGGFALLSLPDKVLIPGPPLGAAAVSSSQYSPKR